MPRAKNIADPLSQLLKINTSNAAQAEDQHVHMVAVNAVPSAMTIREIGRSSAADEELSAI